MPFSLNKIQLIGFLGQDADTKEFEGGGSVTNFTIATTHSWKVKDSDKYEQETTWHRVTIYSVSDWMKEQLKKGAKFYVEGRLQKRHYEKDGAKHLAVDVIADRFNGLIPLTKDAKQAEPEPENKPEALPEKSFDDLPFDDQF